MMPAVCPAIRWSVASSTARGHGSGAPWVCSATHASEWSTGLGWDLRGGSRFDVEVARRRPGRNATAEAGGDEETRTPDPLLAKEMLFQLSYVPSPAVKSGRDKWMVGVSGLEPETSALSGQCSNQLS